MEKRFWVIQREEMQKVVFQSIVPVGQISDRQLDNLIVALNVKYKLEDNEAVACFLKRGTRRHFDFLKVKRDSTGKRTIVYCENTLDITATLYKKSELSLVQE